MIETQPIKVIIADDEPAARSSIATLLANQTDISIVATCTNGDETVKAIMELNPDLVFLDIQMPDKNGFEVLVALEHFKIPVFIFVTAYEQFALKAFEKSAVDYLLKPYDDDRFYQSLAKAKQFIAGSRVINDINPAKKLLAEILPSKPASFSKKIPIKTNGRITFISIDSIIFLESDGNFTKIHTATESKLASTSFKQMQTILDPEIFVRIHKSYIINLEFLEAIEPYFHGDYYIFLKNGQKLKLSRNYKKSIEHLLNPF
ncbi:MAG: two component transcriptional regulator, LytTR family [Daejeonella sp.]|nr:two component transcriptional regulator, LytTR family [Daejeonella sp.]